MEMRHTLLLLLLAATAVIASVPVLGAEHDWQVGRVIDLATRESTATGTSYGSSSSSTQIMFANIRDNELVILSSDFGYVIEDTRP